MASLCQGVLGSGSVQRIDVLAKPTHQITATSVSKYLGNQLAVVNGGLTPTTSAFTLRTSFPTFTLQQAAANVSVASAAVQADQTRQVNDAEVISNSQTL